jgi:hypothetical protein
MEVFRDVLKRSLYEIIPSGKPLTWLLTVVKQPTNMSVAKSILVKEFVCIFNKNLAIAKK